MSPFERLIRNPEGSSYIEFLWLMDEIWRRKERKDAALMVVKKKIELLANSKMSSQESEESSFHIERMLEVILEQVVSTDSGIRELRSDLLDLTQKVKDHEVSIQ
ncbi:hypothetical protein HAX54_005594 [Datura stramonium]|uniref:Uncharacterized protein n=1 Tax=Datura stramonium TaxID=4076 RepID=A0ABS8TAE7_DATST|nr:hypothetical protein [Datura stramonium]